MPASSFQLLMLPLLESLQEGERSMKDIKAALIRFIELTDEALKPFTPEEDDPEFQHAIVQASAHLTKAGLIEIASDEKVRITSLGKMILSKRLNSIDVDYLRRLPGYSE
jgi:restriction endonuclease Mrr